MAAETDRAEKGLPEGRTAIVAGSGTLPCDVAAVLDAAGAAPFVLMVQDHADKALEAYDHQWTTLGGLGAKFSVLLRKDVKNIVLAGGISGRPALHTIRLDRHALRVLPGVVARLGKGDNSLLSWIVQALEKHDMRVVGAHEIVPGLLASAGPHGKRKAAKPDAPDIALGWKAAKALGELDAGQGTVAVGGRVVALEGAEGTDAMLARVRDLRTAGKVRQKGGVLVKCAKPAQELRVDLPSIGPATVRGAAAAGLRGIVVEAGKSLVMERAETIALADKLGIFIEGRTSAGGSDG